MASDFMTHVALSFCGALSTIISVMNDPIMTRT